MAAQDSRGRPLDAGSPDADKVLQPERAIIGLCPSCRALLIVCNWFEVWPYVLCECGWSGATTQIEDRGRYEKGGAVRTHGDVTVVDHALLARVFGEPGDIGRQG